MNSVIPVTLPAAASVAACQWPAPDPRVPDPDSQARISPDAPYVNLSRQVVRTCCTPAPVESTGHAPPGAGGFLTACVTGRGICRMHYSGTGATGRVGMAPFGDIAS